MVRHRNTAFDTALGRGDVGFATRRPATQRHFHHGLLGAVLLVLFAAPGCNAPVQDRPPGEALAESNIVIGHREGKLKSFPCQDCHDKVDTAGLEAPDGPRKHDEIEIGHFEGAQACYACHNEENRDQLRLLTGKTVSFNESYAMCGQCHGEKLRDWKIGAHGKHVGGWSGTKNRLNCADCHDPHSPGLAQVEAQPPPPFPKFGIPKGEH